MKKDNRAKKSLKIPMGQSESVYQRTDNTMAKKVQKDKQRSTKHTYKAKDRVTRTPLKTEAELRCSGMVISSCSTVAVIYKAQKTKDRATRTPLNTGDECRLQLTQVIHTLYDIKLYRVLLATDDNQTNNFNFGDMYCLHT